MTDNHLRDAAKKVIANFCLIPIDVDYEFKVYGLDSLKSQEFLVISVDVDRFFTDSKYMSDISNIPECIESSMRYLSAEFSDFFEIDYTSKNINVTSRIIDIINNDISEMIFDTFDVTMQDVESMGVEVQLYFRDDDEFESGYSIILEILGDGDETEKLGISCDDVLKIVDDVLYKSKFFELYLQSYEPEVWYCNT